MTVNPFAPEPGTNQLLTPTAASQYVSINPNAKCVRLVNFGATNPVHVRVGIGGAAVVATAADLIVLPNSSIVVYKGDADTLAYIWSTAATALYVQPGNGGV
jgi:hypothetical protein